MAQVRRAGWCSLVRTTLHHYTNLVFTSIPAPAPCPGAAYNQWRVLQLEPTTLHRPLRVAVGGEGSRALWVPAPRLAAPQKTRPRLRAGGGWGTSALKAATWLQGGSQETRPRHQRFPRLAGPRKKPAAASAFAQGVLPRHSAFAQRRLAEQDGGPAQGREQERSPSRGLRAGAPGGRGQPGPGCPVSTAPFSAPPASAEAPEGAGWAGREMSPADSSPPGPPRHPGQGAARPTCLAAEPEKGLNARGGWCQFLRSSGRGGGGGSDIWAGLSRSKEKGERMGKCWMGQKPCRAPACHPAPRSRPRRGLAPPRSARSRRATPAAPVTALLRRGETPAPAKVSAGGEGAPAARAPSSLPGEASAGRGALGASGGRGRPGASGGWSARGWLSQLSSPLFSFLKVTVRGLAGAFWGWCCVISVNRGLRLKINRFAFGSGTLVPKLQGWGETAKRGGKCSPRVNTCKSCGLFCLPGKPRCAGQDLWRQNGTAESPLPAFWHFY